MKLKLEVGDVHGSWKGSDLEGIQFQHPFLDLHCARGVLPITSRSIKAAASSTPPPAMARTTFAPAKNMASKPTRRMDDEGRFVEGLPEYKGKTVFEANPHHHRTC